MATTKVPPAKREILVYLRKFDVMFYIPKKQGTGFLTNPINEEAAMLPSMIGYSIRLHDGALIVATGYVPNIDPDQLKKTVIIPVIQCYGYDYRIVEDNQTGTHQACWGLH